ncbi:MAG: TIM barrel protein [bacterium]
MGLIDLREQMKRRTPEELLEHLRSFHLELKFSAGVWFFSPAGGRFHERYTPPMSIEEILERALNLKKYGLMGLEAHYPNEIGEDNLDIWKSFLKDSGMKLVGIAANIFYESRFKFGALSSPLPEVRKIAIERIKETLGLVKDLDADFAIIWPGIDGYENNFGIDFYSMRARFAEGLAEAMDAVPGVRIAFEPKPYEPRGRIIYGTTSEGILLALKVEGMLKSSLNRGLLEEGHSLVTLNPEMGHILMGYEDPPYAYSLAMEYGKLAHTHWNSQPLGNYDQDLNVGLISPELAEATLYVMKMHGYKGYFGIDINPERMPVERAIINCIDALKAMNDRIETLDHEKILYCTLHPDKTEGILEAILIRARAPHPEKLTPLE